MTGSELQNAVGCANEDRQIGIGPRTPEAFRFRDVVITLIGVGGEQSGKRIVRGGPVRVSQASRGFGVGHVCLAQTVSASSRLESPLSDQVCFAGDQGLPADDGVGMRRARRCL